MFCSFFAIDHTEDWSVLELQIRTWFLYFPFIFEVKFFLFLSLATVNVFFLFFSQFYCFLTVCLYYYYRTLFLALFLSFLLSHYSIYFIIKFFVMIFYCICLCFVIVSSLSILLLSILGLLFSLFCKISFYCFIFIELLQKKEIGEETGVNIEFPGVLKKQHMEFSDINKKAVEFAGETKNKVMRKF